MVKGKKLNSFFSIFFFVLLVIYVLTLIIPFTWTFLTSLKERLEYIASPFALPKKWLFKNYYDVFNALKHNVDGERDVYLPELFANGFIYSFFSSVILIASNCVVAYVVAKYKSVVGTLIYSIVIINMILPVVGTLPSELQIMRALGFYDNMFGIFLMKIGFGGTNFLILYATFTGISWAYAEAAFIDGASHFKVFIKIMIPMALPTFFALMLMSFITYWNDWQAPLIYFPSFPTVGYTLYAFQFPGAGNKTSGVPYIMSACILVAMPIVILFCIFRNKIMGTVAIGGLKG